MKDHEKLEQNARPELISCIVQKTLVEDDVRVHRDGGREKHFLGERAEGAKAWRQDAWGIKLV